MNPSLPHDSDTADSGRRQVWSVSGITSKIKETLEDNFPFIWIFGEISNLRVPGSGHFYFTLKDEKAQMAAVMFRGQNRSLKFMPADGMEVVGLGRMSVYEPRGTYQIILEYLEPKGVGALRIAFEQLKQKLADEGLFDEARKRPIPFLPARIGIITSPTGAVVHDIVRVVRRRFENIPLQVAPVRVQGPEAEADIVDALALVNQRGDADVVILARGGGSLEDLWAFNSERVARAVSASRIPVISAVGHETDFSICDFVADLRAPTPSAAAEMAVPVKADLARAREVLFQRLTVRFGKYREGLRDKTRDLSRRLVNPARKVADQRLRVDDLGERMRRGISRRLERLGLSLARVDDRLRAASPRSRIGIWDQKLKQINYNLSLYKLIYFKKNTSELQSLAARLDALNPRGILARGYSITRTLPGRDIVRAADRTAVGQALEVLLASGRLTVEVLEKS